MDTAASYRLARQVMTVPITYWLTMIVDTVICRTTETSLAGTDAAFTARHEQPGTWIAEALHARRCQRRQTSPTQLV